MHSTMKLMFQYALDLTNSSDNKTVSVQRWLLFGMFVGPTQDMLTVKLVRWC